MNSNFFCLNNKVNKDTVTSYIGECKSILPALGAEICIEESWYQDANSSRVI